ncbi:MAG: RNA polymerase subunit sigma-24 [Chloroflexota bacterium]|nr:MAG: RNA polymerase subunit sigma-24 [Chloroflexota bacterium]
MIAPEPQHTAPTAAHDLIHLSEDELLVLAQAGDDVAYGALVLKLESPVRRFAHRLIGQSWAEDDIVQDVFMSLLQHLDRVDPARGVRPYIFRMVRNRCYDELRRQGRYETVPIDDEPAEDGGTVATLEAPDSQPDDAAHWLMLQLEVREAMEALPEPQRQALILFAEEELSYAEIAEVLGTNIGTVKSRLFHAKKALRRLLRPETVQAIETGLRDGV